MVEAITCRNELVVVINEIIATKILLQYIIFIVMTYFVAKTYYHRVYCNKMKVIATKISLQLTFFLVVLVDIVCTEILIDILRT